MIRVLFRSKLATALALLFAASIEASAQNSGVEGTPSADPDAIVRPSHMTQGMLPNVVPKVRPFEILRLAGLPANDGVTNRSYSYFPLTVAYSGAVSTSQTSTFSTAKYAWLQWTNRCTQVPTCVAKPPKPNSVPGRGFYTSDKGQAGQNFTTYDRADAATIADSLYVNGFPAHATGPCPTGLTHCGYLDVTEAAGIPDSQVIPYETARANPDSLFPGRVTVAGKTYAYATDLVLLTDSKFGVGTGTAWGTVCDCEMADGRPASRLTSLITQIAHIHHAKGRKYAVIPDPFLGAGMITGFCGLGVVWPNCDQANLGSIASVVDLLFIVIGEAPRGYTFASLLNKYYSMFGKPGVDFPPSHLGITFIMAPWPRGTKIEDARYAHDFIVANGFGGVQLGPTPGQQCRWTVLKTLILLGLPTGTCNLNVD